MVSMIPEQEIFLDTFASIAAASGGNRTITLNSTFVGNFSLVPNLYVGCVLEIYADSGDAFTDKTVVVSNTGNTITVSDTLDTAITSSASSYYGVLRQFGSPVPAPTVGGLTGTITNVTITDGGSAVQADKYIISGSEIPSGTFGSGSSGEITLTLSAATATFTFVDEASDKYKDNSSGSEAGYVTLYVADNTDTSDGQDSVNIVFDVDEGYTAPSAGDLANITIDISAGDNANSIAEAFRVAVNTLNMTATRDGAVVTVTNTTGGEVDTWTETTNGGVAISGFTDGGTVTAASITNAGSGYTAATGNITHTNIGSGSSVTLSVTTSSTGNPRLLSDTWIGLADSITVPTTSVEMKQLNLASAGTRNYIYQFKGAESTDGGSINLFANNFSFLYYALGKKVIGTVGNETSATLTNEHITSGLSGTNFIFDDTGNTGDRFYRVEGNTICPPIRKGIDDTAGVKKVGTGASDFITYTYTEENGEELPSFALEYTLKKGSQLSTVATDANSEAVYSKIYPGCQVNTLTITADEGQEIKLDVSLMTKTTVVADTNYETFNGETDVQNFVNYGSRVGGQAGQDDGLMTPYFFSDGTIEMFGNEYIRIQNCTLTINNGLQDKRYIGRTNKTIKTMVTGQRTYELSFTGYVTDDAIFEALRNDTVYGLQSSDNQDIKLNFYKANGEQVQLHFRNYVVKTADFPLTNDNSPISVSWTIEPLTLAKAEETTYWVIQG